MAKITVQNTQITVIKQNEDDYISLTDMLKAKDGEFFFSNWLRNRNTIEFLGIWERLMNPNFNCAEFDIIKSQAGLNRFRLSAKEWTEKTNAIGIISKAGRYGGTYAHKGIAFEFAMWISPEFKVYLIREFQRLKDEEQKQLGWTAKRELKGNIRDYASINELICLANMENINAVLIDEGVPQGDRLVRLNQIAINQMRVLENDDNRNLLK